MTCPRCKAVKESIRKEHQGLENGAVLWSVYYCTSCSFTWRDSEPEEVTDYEVRDPFFRVDPENPGGYPYISPPAKIK